MKVSIVLQFLLLNETQKLFAGAFLPPTSRHLTWGENVTPSIRQRVSSAPTAPLAATLPLVPSCSASQVGKTILVAGAAGLISQLSLHRLFRRFRIPQPALRAHSVVALTFVVLLSFYGSIGWWSLPSATTASARLLGMDPSARWMGATVVGAMGLWDIPTTLSVKELRKPDVVIHHCMMTLVALVGALQLPTYYAYFYLGVCELSSIPLVLLMLCTPQQQEQQTPGKRFAALQPILSVLTAVSFSIVRAFYFTKVTLRNFIPDIASVWSGVAMSTGQRQAIRFLLVASLGFTLLQLYWFYTQIVSVVWNGKNNAT